MLKSSKKPHWWVTMDRNKSKNKSNQKKQGRKCNGNKSKPKKPPIQPKQPSERQNRFIETAEAAKAAKEKAHKIVLGLIEDTCDPQSFVEKCKYIDPDLYEDVVTERSIAETCGYPLCRNTFRDTYGDRTYVIRHNSVYDITNRRNFCSDVCYEASEIVQKQISTAPMYLRVEEEEEESSAITIPDRSDLKGIPGKFINIKGPVLQLEDDDFPEKQNKRKTNSKGSEGLTVSDVAHSGLINCAENCTPPEDEVKSDSRTKTEIENSDGTKVYKVDTTCSGSEKCELDSERQDVQECIDTSINNFNKSESSGNHSHTAKGKTAHSSKTRSKDQRSKSKGVEKASKAPADRLAEVREVEIYLREWMNFESLRFILGDLYVRGMLEAFGRQWEDYDSTAGLRLGMEAKAKYIALCRRLDREDREDILDIQQDSRNENPTETMPDLEQLAKDAKNQKLKVRAFYSGQEELEDSDPEEEKQLETIPEEGEGNTDKQHTVRSKKLHKRDIVDEMDSPALPLIDSYSQMAWRRTVVMEKIDTVLSDTLLVVNMRESYSEIHSLMKELVSLFDLAAHNIMMTPAQWTLVILVMLKMFSVRYVKVDQDLKSEESSRGIMVILQNYGLDFSYLDRILSYLTEIQYIISKYHKVDNYNDHQDFKERNENSHNVHEPGTQKSTDVDSVSAGNKKCEQVSTCGTKKLEANSMELPNLNKTEIILDKTYGQGTQTELDLSGHRTTVEEMTQIKQIAISDMMQSISLQEGDLKEDPYADLPPLEELDDSPVHLKYTDIEELD
ncbi:putative RNA polymerase II subunit B1 CTD phosphatase RPAP2 isoform X2 [Oratosquilla oratoria]|uniref:putative RNA polymerase II subunit B1 CTD phosphatase RPAP2 isoform X2 n=1 Tax=Oratosquilla oratoria TaxID=337810 RepID=UPI003F757524